MRVAVRRVRSMLPATARIFSRIAKLLDPNRKVSYSQEGEDMVLNRLLEGRQSGFYVDVGAHHPIRFSNTNLFYERGWRGVNIEPSPNAVSEFQRKRPRDINLTTGVAEKNGDLTYYIFDDPALNTFDQGLMRERETKTSYKVIDTKRVPVERLEEILERHLPSGQAIDFMSVDVEGFDLQVLRSNDWSRYRPEFVLVEALDFRFAMANQHPVHIFMDSVGYELVAKTVNTLFYRGAK
jgi:FkbM family methyltransferase